MYSRSLIRKLPISRFPNCPWTCRRYRWTKFSLRLLHFRFHPTRCRRQRFHPRHVLFASFLEIRLVPAAALQAKTGRGNLLTERVFGAFGACFQRCLTDLLDGLELMSTLIAPILVDWHFSTLTRRLTDPESDNQKPFASPSSKSEEDKSLPAKRDRPSRGAHDLKKVSKNTVISLTFCCLTMAYPL